MLEKLKFVLSHEKPRRTFLIVSAAYLVLYMILIGNILLLWTGSLSVSFAENWTERILAQRVAFDFEPVAAFYLFGIAILFSPANFILGLVMAVLVGLNAGFLVFALEQPKICGKATPAGVISSLPTVLMGFACCAPTMLVALGSAAASVTLGFITLRTFFYPLAFVGLLASLWFNLHNLRNFR